MRDIFLELEKSISLDNPIKGFEDDRIAGLQGVIDYIFSDGGKRYAPSLDVTEFFRLGEDFNIGYKLVQECIGPSINNQICENSSPRGLNDLIKNYCLVLNGEKSIHLSKSLESLAENGMGTSFQLLNGTYMNAEPNVTLFKDKKVLVTGSDTGIGRATALEFLRRGAKVALHYPTEKFSRGAKSVVELAKEYGQCAEAFQGDFRKIEQILKFVDNAINYLGGVDIIINNAGITMNKAFEEVSAQQFSDLMNVNIGGAYFVTQRAVPYMRKQGKGVVVNLSSVHGFNGVAGHSVYATTKAGIVGLTRELAIELSPEIRVNAVAPGWVATANHFRLMSELNFSEIGINETTSGFISNPRNMARHIIELASENSNYINGQTIMIDGGGTAGMYSGRNCTKVSEVPFGKDYIENI